MHNTITPGKIKKLASIIKRKRGEKSLSVTEAAEKLGLSRVTYSRYEQGERIPSIECLLNISTLYDINPMELICALIPVNKLSSQPEYKNFKIYTNNDLSMSEQELLLNYNKLNQTQKAAIKTLINSFL